MAQNTIDFAAQSLYLAYFGRPADNDGFANAKAALSGLTLNPANASSLIDLKNAFFGGDAAVTGLANVLANSSESQRVFGDIKANPEAFVNAVFNSAFGRPPVAAGRDFWVNEIKNGLNPAGAAIAIIAGAFENAAAQADRDTVISKLAYAQAFTDAANTPEEKAQYSGEDAGNAGRAYLAAVTSASDKDATNIAKAAEDAVKALATNSTFTLTEGRDVQTANIFEAPRGFTPGGTDQVNTLDDDDVLTGSGADARLDFTFVDDADIGTVPITPTLKGIPTINVSVQGAAIKNLDLQDADGVDNINISRINASNLVQVTSIKEGSNNTFSVNNSSNPLATVNFAHLTPALSGATDTTKLTLNNAQLLALNLDNTLFGVGGAVVTAPTQGYETITIDSVGSPNAIGTLGIFGNNTLNVTGKQNLLLGASLRTGGPVSTNQEASNFQAGLNGVFGFLSNVNAQALTGALTYHIGTEINGASSGGSGAPIEMTITGGNQGDTFVLATGALVGGATNNTDKIIGGDGTDKVVVTGNDGASVGGAFQINANATTPNITQVEGLEIRSGHDANAGADTISVDADAFDAALATVFVRNEGQTVVGGVATSAGEQATVNLVDLKTAQAGAITVAHGTTGNNALGDLVLTVDLKTPGTTDTVAVNLVSDLNTDTRFNLQLNATSGAGTAGNVENITINGTDNESNTVFLQSFAGHTGTITLTGGQAGQFMNLDGFVNGTTFAGAFNLDTRDAPGPVPAVPVTLADSVVQTADAALGTAVVAANRLDSASANAGLGIRDGVAGDVRLVATTIAAGTSVDNVIVRLGETATAPVNTTVTTGTGNDVVIFDSLVGAQQNSAGLSSADKVAMGTGFDTVAIDGAFATGIVLDSTEFSGLTGVDALRFVSNGGVATPVANVVTGGLNGQAASGYQAKISNTLVAQTDAGNRLLIINNDGDLDADIESNLVLDLRELTGDQAVAANSRLVTFVGANGDTVANGGNPAVSSSNRLQFTEQSATNGMILNGGDNDINALTGNNNVYEVFGNANLTISDLAQTSNFGRIELSNDGTNLNTTTVTMDDATLTRLVDSSAVGAERLAIVANNTINTVGGGISGVQQVNVVGGSLTGNSSLDIVLGAGLNNIATGAGSDTLTFTGNYTTAQAATKPNIAVGQTTAVGQQQITAASRATGVNEFGVDGIAGNADDAAARIVYTGNYALAGGINTVNIYGAVDLTGAALTGVTATNIFSNVDLTENQIDTELGTITFRGTGAHVLNISDSAGNASADLTRVNVASGSGAITVVVEAGAAAAGNVQFNATAGDDRFNGTNLNDTINGLAGNDVINGGAGNDNINGGDGADVVIGGDGADTLSGGGVADGVTVNRGWDVIAGLAGNDIINLTADGGAGFANVDEVHYRSIDGSDTINGFTAADKLSFLDTGVTDNVTGSVNFADSTDGVGSGAAGTLLNGNDFEDLATAAAFQALNATDAHVIAVGTNAAAVDVSALLAGANGVTNSYVLGSDGAGNTQVYYDADWSDVAGRTLVATLVGFDIDGVDTAALFTVYDPAVV